MYCGSKPGTSRFGELARELGLEMARRGVGLVYGGGAVGLMGQVADAVLAQGGEVIGVIPRHLVEAELAHQHLSELIVVESRHARKAKMAELSDGFIALPGGFGTLDETFEILTWNQLGLIARPVVFLDADGFWDPLFAQIAAMDAAGLLAPGHARLAGRTDQPGNALDLVAAGAIEVGVKWASGRLQAEL